MRADLNRVPRDNGKAGAKGSVTASPWCGPRPARARARPATPGSLGSRWRSYLNNQLPAFGLRGCTITLVTYPHFGHSYTCSPGSSANGAMLTISFISDRHRTQDRRRASRLLPLHGSSGMLHVPETQSDHLQATMQGTRIGCPLPGRTMGPSQGWKFKRWGAEAGSLHCDLVNRASEAMQHGRIPPARRRV